MKILHLITDHQVIERTLGVYEDVFPRCNDVLVFSEKGKPFKRLRGNYDGKIVNFDNLREVATSYDFSGVTYIVAHYMSMDKIDFIKYVPKNIHVCWEVYGYDLYNQFLESNGFELYYTKPTRYERHNFLREYCPNIFNILATIKGYRYCFKFQKNRQFKYIANRINSIQYCCGYDAEYIKQYIKKDICSYEVFNYSLDEVLGDLRGAGFSVGDEILIGNSASFSNNHLYVLQHLKRINIAPDQRFILPLSYGGTVQYADDIENAYRSTYPGQVKTLRKYIPLQEYNRRFTKVRAMILSAWRQESQGTAMMGFYMGIKVIMSEKSPLYKWFLDCGFVVYSLENISEEDLVSPLTENEKVRNRALVEKRYNGERIKEIFRNKFN